MDAIYSLLSIIQYSRLCQKKPPPMWPSLTILQHTRVFSGRVFVTNSMIKTYYDAERCGVISVNASTKSQCEFFTALIPSSKFVQVKRGLPEGSRLSPILFGIVVADLIRRLRKEFSHCTHVSVHFTSCPSGGPQSGGPASTSSIRIRGIFYVDDLCLCSTDPLELQP